MKNTIVLTSQILVGLLEKPENLIEIRVSNTSADDFIFCRGPTTGNGNDPIYLTIFQIG